MGAVSAPRPQGQGNWTGLFGNPGLLAGVAAGLVSAVLALWAMHGLPLGTGLFWLTSFPLFVAGLGFGAASRCWRRCWRPCWWPASAAASRR